MGHHSSVTVKSTYIGVTFEVTLKPVGVACLGTWSSLYITVEPAASSSVSIGVEAEPFRLTAVQGPHVAFGFVMDSLSSLAMYGLGTLNKSGRG
jgi:hypothetical protein